MYHLIFNSCLVLLQAAAQALRAWRVWWRVARGRVAGRDPGQPSQPVPDHGAHHRVLRDGPRHRRRLAQL